MIPLQLWGNYGAHNVPGGRNPGWYDHDATIGGVRYHVYVTKGSDGAFLYNFGGLNGNYGRTGWKMIAFLPAVMPVQPGEIDLAAIINYVTTRKDAHGNPWATGKEYVSSVELGVEPVVGSGDLVVSNYKVWSDANAPAPAPSPAPAPARACTVACAGTRARSFAGTGPVRGCLGVERHDPLQERRPGAAQRHHLRGERQVVHGLEREQPARVDAQPVVGDHRVRPSRARTGAGTRSRAGTCADARTSALVHGRGVERHDALHGWRPRPAQWRAVHRHHGVQRDLEREQPAGVDASLWSKTGC